jgi:hypothetical protein
MTVSLLFMPFLGMKGMGEPPGANARGGGWLCGDRGVGWGVVSLFHVTISPSKLSLTLGTVAR